MEDIVVPDKKYFKIGETSSMLGVKPHVLRYWETEFPQIRPTKSKTGQRMYRRRDVEALIRIQKLLYRERFTIAGARKALRLPAELEENMENENVRPSAHVALISAKKELEELLRILEG